MNHLTTLKKRLRLIACLATDAPFDFETMDSIAREALRAIDELEQQTSVDNVLEFHLRESTAEASQMLSCIVETSNN